MSTDGGHSHSLSSSSSSSTSSRFSVYVKNIHASVTDDVLFQFFCSASSPLRAVVVKHAQTMKPRGYGFVHYGTMEECYHAVASFNGQALEGNLLEVAVSKAKSNSGPTSSSPVSDSAVSSMRHNPSASASSSSSHHHISSSSLSEPSSAARSPEGSPKYGEANGMMQLPVSRMSSAPISNSSTNNTNNDNNHNNNGSSNNGPAASPPSASNSNPPSASGSPSAAASGSTSYGNDLSSGVTQNGSNVNGPSDGGDTFSPPLSGSSAIPVPTSPLPDSGVDDSFEADPDTTGVNLEEEKLDKVMQLGLHNGKVKKGRKVFSALKPDEPVLGPSSLRSPGQPITPTNPNVKNISMIPQRYSFFRIPQTPSTEDLANGITSNHPSSRTGYQTTRAQQQNPKVESTDLNTAQDLVGNVLDEDEAAIAAEANELPAVRKAKTPVVTTAVLPSRPIPEMTPEIMQAKNGANISVSALPGPADMSVQSPSAKTFTFRNSPNAPSEHAMSDGSGNFNGGSGMHSSSSPSSSQQIDDESKTEEDGSQNLYKQQQQQTRAPTFSLYVGNIPRDSERSYLKECLQAASPNTTIVDLTLKNAYCFVHFATAEEADMALETFSNCEIEGNLLNVQPAKSRPTSVSHGGQHSMSGLHGSHPQGLTSHHNHGPSTTIYVQNLPIHVNEEGLKRLFEHAGPVVQVVVVRDKYPGAISKGFGFVEFDTVQGCENAIRMFNNASFEGQNLRVEVSRQRTKRRPRSDRERQHSQRM